MTGCKQWVAGVGSDRSTNCATTTTLNINVNAINRHKYLRPVTVE